MAQVLIVEDEKEIGDLIEVYLQMDNHRALKFCDPTQVLTADLSEVDIGILDIMMPEIDGLALCQKLRLAGHLFPIIMLTAKDTDQDIISGLAFGADDYMVKPFNPLELMARISAQLRRVQQFGKAEPTDSPLQFHGLQMDEKAHLCTLYGKKISLTPTEFSILLLLLKNQGQVLSSESIFETIWQEKYWESNNTIMTHIQKIRKKLGDTEKQKRYIQTIWGVGYKLDDKI